MPGGIAGSIVQLGDTDRKGRVKYCTNDGLVKSMGGLVQKQVRTRREKR